MGMWIMHVVYVVSVVYVPGGELCVCGMCVSICVWGLCMMCVCVYGMKLFPCGCNCIGDPVDPLTLGSDRSLSILQRPLFLKMHCAVVK